MSARGRQGRSTLHLQLGQETIYLIMAIAMFAALVMAAMLMRQHEEQKKRPSIIPMPETQGYAFGSNSAVISAEFRRKLLEKVVPRIIKAGKENKSAVIEVIGHTDEQTFDKTKLKSNLDKVLMSTLLGKASEPARAVDNAGLGMARAISVASILRQVPELSRFEIMPLSAGPFQRVDDRVTDGSGPREDADRRRIVIRVRPHFSKDDETAAP